MFDRHSGGEKAVLVHIEYRDYQHNQLAELQELARSAGAEILAVVEGRRDKPDVKYSIGQGKVEEIAETAKALGAELVIFNHELTPSQERNLEKVIDCRVLDRTGLILDIFARRAQTFEGKLQVELAQLGYMSTRLKRAWTHLERQRGGSIGLTGPGETQLELDKRMLQIKMYRIRKRIERVQNARQLSRQSRQKSEVPTVSLVGYTNAGKSTLFNALTGENIYVQDQLFATLDPTLRQINVPQLGKVIVADTVGFVRHLPHQLVEAFSATLEETTLATLLLHVVDAADAEKLDLMAAVDEVLEEIGALEIPTLLVMNKIDLLGEAPRIDRDRDGMPTVVWLSSQDNTGLDLLQQALVERISESQFIGKIELQSNEGQLRSRLYQLGYVQDEAVDEHGVMLLSVSMPRSQLRKLCGEARVYDRIVDESGFDRPEAN